MKNFLNKCKETKELINQSISWVENNLEKEESDLIVSHLKDFRADSRNLELSSNGKPTLAVFGESQIGKSYFMSELLKNKNENTFYLKFKSPNEKYNKYFNDNYVDFIKRINPNGPKESSGVVTRFTISEDNQKVNAQIPVKFLRQVDLAMILADTYALDIKNKSDLDNYEYSELIEILKSLSLSTVNEEIDGLSEDDIVDFKNYLNKYLKDSSSVVQSFNQNKLWDTIITLLPRVSYSERYKVYEIFWGKIPVFTQIFNKLSDILKKINFETEAHLELDSLLPKEEKSRSCSIIDVSTIEEFLSQDKLRTINIHTSKGIASSIGIGEVTTLLREITLTVDDRILNDNKRKFLNEIDILDFPGARGRKNYDVSRVESLQSFLIKNDDEENILKECIVRGKVHFLFNYYSDMNDITSLIFAQKNSNQEVNYLPKLIDNWVINTYGNTPESRVGKDINLFISFHFFNIDLNGKPSDIESDVEQYNALWKSRFYNNVEQFVGTQIRNDDNWIHKWTPSEEFKNFFFLRDPDNTFNTATKVDKNGNEVYQNKKINYEQKHYDMKQSFINDSYVKRYVPKPLELWEASASLGYTGVEHIVNNVSPVTTVNRRLEQLETRLQRVIDATIMRISSLYNSGDYDEDLKFVKKKTEDALKSLLISMKTKNSFGNILDKLLLPEDLAWKTLYDIQNPIFEYSLDGLKTDFEEDKSDMIDIDISEFGADLDLELDGLFESSSNDTKNEIISNKHQTKSEIFVDKLLSNWIEFVDSNFTEDDISKLGLSKEVITWILLNLKDSMLRSEFKEFLSSKLQIEIDRYIQNPDSIFLVSRLSRNYFNSFINSYGWNHVMMDERPKMRDGNFLFFTELESENKKYRVSFLNHKDIKLDNIFPGKDRFNHWLKGFQETTLLNLQYKYSDGGVVLNSEENEKIGLIINKLSI